MRFWDSKSLGDLRRSWTPEQLAVVLKYLGSRQFQKGIPEGKLIVWSLWGHRWRCSQSQRDRCFPEQIWFPFNWFWFITSDSENPQQGIFCLFLLDWRRIRWRRGTLTGLLAWYRNAQKNAAPCFLFSGSTPPFLPVSFRRIHCLAVISLSTESCPPSLSIWVVELWMLGLSFYVGNPIFPDSCSFPKMGHGCSALWWRNCSAALHSRVTLGDIWQGLGWTHSINLIFPEVKLILFLAAFGLSGRLG